MAAWPLESALAFGPDPFGDFAALGAFAPDLPGVFLEAIRAPPWLHESHTNTPSVVAEGTAQHGIPLRAVRPRFGRCDAEPQAETGKQRAAGRGWWCRRAACKSRPQRQRPRQDGEAGRQHPGLLAVHLEEHPRAAHRLDLDGPGRAARGSWPAATWRPS